MSVLVAEKVRVGAGAAATVMVTDCGSVVPPGPVQVIVYVLLAVRLVVFLVPLVACVPVQSPVAVQLVALVEDQLMLVEVL